MKRSVVVGVLSVGLALAAGAAPVPTVDELLSRIEETYAQLLSFEAVWEMTLEIADWYAVRQSIRVWASYPRLRADSDLGELAVAVYPGMTTVIVDVAMGRQLTLIREGVWREEEVAPDWAQQAMIGVSAFGQTAFTSVGEEDLGGRPTWVLEGRTAVSGWVTPVRVWVDQESLWIRKTESESGSFTVRHELRDFRPKVEVPEDVFVLPPGARVIVRSPRSPEAEEIMNRVWETYGALTSFVALRRGGHPGWREDVWYHDPILRIERTSLYRIPAVSVEVWDLARGIVYSERDGRWEGTAFSFFSFPPGQRLSLALAVVLGLRPGMRYTAVEERVVDGRPAWQISGESQAVLDEGPEVRWWVEQETYTVLQYEEPITVFVYGVRQQEVRTVRIERFEPNAEVAGEKLFVPEGVPIRWLGAPGPLGTDDPGERAEQGVAWMPFSAERLAAARAEGKPVLLYFTAEWCRPCREFEDGALHDARVVAAVEGFARLVVDLTDWGSPEAAQVRSVYRMAGVPLIVVLRPDGLEAGRAQGNVAAAVLLDTLRFAAPVR